MTNFHFASGKSCNKLATAKIISLLVESQNTQPEKNAVRKNKGKKRKGKAEGKPRTTTYLPGQSANTFGQVLPIWALSSCQDSPKSWDPSRGASWEGGENNLK